MPLAALALTPSPWTQIVDPNGTPYANGKLFVFEAGGEVPATVYQDSIGTPHTHPIILDALGSATIWLPASDRAFKYVLYDRNNVLIKSADNITWEFPENAPPIPGFNADLLDGHDSSEFLLLPSAGAAVVPFLNADLLDGIDSTLFALLTDLTTQINALRVELQAYTNAAVAAVPVPPPTTYVPPRVSNHGSAAGISVNCDASDVTTINGLAENTTITNPIGTPEEMQPYTFRIRDNGTARALFWQSAYMAGGYMPLPGATVAFKTLHIGFRWNAFYAKWQMVALTQEP